MILFFVPADQTTIKVHLPFASKFDRFAVMALVFCWVIYRGDQRTVWKSPRSKLYVGAAAMFFATLTTGLLINSTRAISLNEWDLAEKQLLLVASLITVSWFTLTSLRPEDLRGFATLIVGLGTAMATGMIVESHTGYNVFYSVSHTVLSPIANVGAAATDLNAASQGVGRSVVVGPTAHGLCAVTMLAIAMPFALVRVVKPSSRRSWWLNAIAVALMCSGAIATQEKTGLLSLLAVFAFVGVHQPRKMVRLLPLGVVLIGFIHAAAPGSLGAVLDLSRWFDNGSSAHRAADLTAIWPDVLSHPLFGRGYGTVDISRAAQFRIMDDQFLGMLWQTGFLGLGAYIWMIVAPIVASTRVRLARDPELSPVVLAASAGCVAYLVVNWLFDTLSFVQGPYMFFIIAAMCTVATGAVAPARAKQRVAVQPSSAVAVPG